MKTKTQKNTGKFLLNTIFVACLGVMCATASAQERYGYENILINGSPNQISVAQGFGRDVTLLDALDKVVPNGWVVKKDDPNNHVNVNKVISWKGGQPWLSVVNQLSYQGNFQALVDWDKREIVLVPDPVLFGSTKTKSRTKVDPYGDQKDRVKPSNQDMFVPSVMRKMEYQVPANAQLVSDTTVIFDKNGRIIAREKEYERANVATNAVAVVQQNNVEQGVKRGEFKMKKAPATTQTEKTVDVVQVNSEVVSETTVTRDEFSGVEIFDPTLEMKTASIDQSAGSIWVLEAHKSLKDNVIEWGKSVGYQVVWNGDNYPVDENRTLFGVFDAENGPIMQLAVDYGPESRVKSPLSFKLYQNKTLVVDNLRYEQGGQYSAN